MEIDFAVAVPDYSHGLAFATVAAPMGFRTELYQGEKTQKWTCYCSRTMVPSYEAMIATQKTLAELGQPYGARPDGWGSFGNAPPE
jgi:Regulator of ribonuclease activity B